jgi:N-acetylated-alpha-linked acidic dipeptidase
VKPFGAEPCAGFVALAVALSGLASAEEPDPHRFWRRDRREAQHALEATLLSLPNPERLRALHDKVSSEPHLAGSPGDARVVATLVETLQGLGLEVERQELRLYLARPIRAELHILAPKHIVLPVREDVLPEDRWSRHPGLGPGWVAYSGNGDVTGPVVYTNYGRKEDFEQLARLGVSLKGRIALARYGGNFRGYKARFAEAAGASGLVIYSDPGDSGYALGIEYPGGGWAHPSAIERGSLLTLPYPGDPLTPFEPATAEAERLDPATLDLPRIPVQPIGSRAAREILSRMTGPAVPRGWQGGLPFTYRLTGADGLKVRLRVEQERRLFTTANVVATLKGGRWAEQKVIVGSHHDAWTFGAADPNAGTIAVLEAARSFAEAARRGQRPERSIVFANWAAEEFGLLGSTEWVEAHREELRAGAVAYLNLDGAALGLELGASASPSLKGVIADAARAIPQPGGPAGQTVFEAWLARGEDPDRPGLPRMGDLGGGSDHVAFLCHLGIPSAGLSASGASGTAYHSAYDDLAWYRKVVGNDYASAALVTQMTNLVLARLANADLVPLDVPAYGLETPRLTADFATQARAHGISADLGRVAAAGRDFARRGRAFLAPFLDRLGAGSIAERDLYSLNERLRLVERAWADPAGLPGRPFFKNQFVATDEDSGYASWLLPAARRGLERRDQGEIDAGERRIAAIFERQGDLLASPLELPARVRASLAGFPGTVSLFAKNLDDGQTFGLDADRRVRSASTIKLPILVEAHAQVAEGRLAWTDRLNLTDDQKAPGAGVLRELSAGLGLTLRDAVSLMILISDNTATNLVLDRVTTDAVNARMEALGFSRTRSLKKIGGTGASKAASEPANQGFGIGVTTTREMVGLLEALAKGEIVSVAASKEMVDLLKRQQYHDGIGRSLRGVAVASKPGALDRLRSDVGIVYTARGRIALAITCENLPETDSTPDNPAYQVLSRLSLILADGLATFAN